MIFKIESHFNKKQFGYFSICQSKWLNLGRCARLDIVKPLIINIGIVSNSNKYCLDIWENPHEFHRNYSELMLLEDGRYWTLIGIIFQLMERE